MGTMVRKKAVAVPVMVMVLLLGLAATGLSFFAYAKRIKAEDIRFYGKGLCIYPSSAAFAVGILAAVILLIQQILLSAGIACFCCGRNKFPCNLCGVIAFILFLLSWASFVITFIGLVYTAVINNRSVLRSQGNTSSGLKKEECLKGQENLFLGTAVWCGINVIFSLTCYATYMCGVRRHKDRATPLHNVPA